MNDSKLSIASIWNYRTQGIDKYKILVSEKKVACDFKIAYCKYFYLF